MYDSHKSSFTGSSVLGQLSLSNGSSSLSEYALCVMMLSLFNLHYRSIKFPVGSPPRSFRDPNRLHEN